MRKIITPQLISHPFLQLSYMANCEWWKKKIIKVTNWLSQSDNCGNKCGISCNSKITFIEIITYYLYYFLKRKRKCVFQTLNVKCFNYCRIHKLFFLKSCHISMLQLIARLTWERILVNMRKVKDITVIPIGDHQYSPVPKLVTSILFLGKWKFIFRYWLVHIEFVVFIPLLILFLMVIYEEQSLDRCPIALSSSW